MDRPQKLLQLLTEKFIPDMEQLTSDRIMWGQAAHPRRVELSPPGPKDERYIMPKLGYQIKGHKIIQVGNNFYRLTPGDLCLVPRMTAHYSWPLGPDQPYEVLTFSFSQVQRLWILHYGFEKNRGPVNYAIVHFSVPSSVIKLFEPVKQKKSAALNVRMVRRDMRTLCGLLAGKIAKQEYFLPTTFEENKSWKQRDLGRMEKYIQEHLTEKLTLERIAQEMNLSASHLRYLFKLEYGDSLFEYIINVKLKCAVELLHKPELSITEVAGQLHYDDIYFFSRQFKKYFGISPREYREKYIRFG